MINIANSFNVGDIVLIKINRKDALTLGIIGAKENDHIYLFNNLRDGSIPNNSTARPKDYGYKYSWSIFNGDCTSDGFFTDYDIYMKKIADIKEYKDILNIDSLKKKLKK